MISQRYLPGCGSSWDQNHRRYATLEPGKSTVPGGASGSAVSGPTSDQVTPSFNCCPEKRLNVSIPIPGFTRMSSISVGRITVVWAAPADEQNRIKRKVNRVVIPTEGRNPLFCRSRRNSRIPDGSRRFVMTKLMRVIVLESDAQPQANLASRCNSFLIVSFNQLAEAGVVFEVAIRSRDRTAITDGRCIACDRHQNGLMSRGACNRIRQVEISHHGKGAATAPIIQIRRQQRMIEDVVEICSEACSYTFRDPEILMHAYIQSPEARAN